MRKRVRDLCICVCARAHQGRGGLGGEEDVDGGEGPGRQEPVLHVRRPRRDDLPRRATVRKSNKNRLRDTREAQMDRGDDLPRGRDTQEL